MNKNVLVIAGSSQIGLEAVKLLLKSGFNVYLTSRSTVDLEHKHLYKYSLDVCSNNSFDCLFEQISNLKFRAIVNNAGCVVATPVEFLDESELHRQLDVNLFGLLRVIKKFAQLLDTDGRIINISSMAS